MLLLPETQAGGSERRPSILLPNSFSFKKSYICLPVIVQQVITWAHFAARQVSLCTPITSEEENGFCLANGSLCCGLKAPNL